MARTNKPTRPSREGVPRRRRPAAFPPPPTAEPLDFFLDAVGLYAARARAGMTARARREGQELLERAAEAVCAGGYGAPAFDEVLRERVEFVLDATWRVEEAADNREPGAWLFSFPDGGYHIHAAPAGAGLAPDGIPYTTPEALRAQADADLAWRAGELAQFKPAVRPALNYLGAELFQVGDDAPFIPTPREHDVLLAFIDQQAISESVLRSLSGQASAVAVLRQLARKKINGRPGYLAYFIHFPGTKSAEGYRVEVADARQKT